MNKDYQHAEHLAWLLTKCPHTLQGKFFDAVKDLQVDQYFALTAWAVNQTTRSKPAHTDDWYEMIIDESTNYVLGI